MGQYYQVLTQKHNQQNKSYNGDVLYGNHREYTMAKLMEHSWWYNGFVNSICKKIFDANEQIRVAWIGDYAEDTIAYADTDTINGLTQKDIDELFADCWKTEGNAVQYEDFTLDGMYLINHTKKVFVDCSKYCQNNKTTDNWCIHPLPLLTCIGNGLGGGDYSNPTEDSTTELVSSWAWDWISIEKTIPDGYEEICPIFKENYNY